MTQLDLFPLTVTDADREPLTEAEQVERDLYEYLGIEVYTVGEHTLWRAAGLRTLRDGRFQSLECNIMPWEYPAPTHNRQRLVVACGMGTDSIAMLVGLWLRGIRPDVIQWADTGSERQHTYRYLPVLQAWLKSVDFPPLLIVRRRCPDAWHRSLFEQAWNTKQLPAAAFHTNHSCSIEWKLKPQRNWQKRCDWLWTPFVTAIGFDADEAGSRKGTKDAKPVEAIGFDKDEAANRKSLRYSIETDPDFTVWLPLAEWGLDRAACVALIESVGLPAPGKSACFMCPVSKLCELNAMTSEEPANIDAAVGLEAIYRDSKNFRDGRVQGLAGKKTWADLVGTEAADPGIGLVAGELPEAMIVSDAGAMDYTATPAYKKAAKAAATKAAKAAAARKAA